MDEIATRAATRPSPPSADQLQRALDLLPIAPDVHAAAAVHLATPVDAPVGMATWLEEGAWHYRGHRVAGLSDPVTTALALAHAGHTPDSRYHDLDCDDPASWCKLVRSGSRQMLFGSDVLLGAPTVAAAADVPARAIFQALRLWLTDPTFRPPTVVTLPEGACLLDGDGDWLMLRNV